MSSFYPTKPDPHGSDNVLSMARDLYSKHPEMQNLEAWEVQHVLWTLNYTDELIAEGAIAAIIEVARTDFDPDEGTA
jgi:hypothetical protein